MIDFEEDITTGEALWRVNQKNWLTKHGRPVPKALSKAERLEYQKCFDMIEADSGGSLSADDIHKLLTVSSRPRIVLYSFLDCTKPADRQASIVHMDRDTSISY